MVISELALGFLTNLIYDSSKKIPKEISDTYSKVYDKAIEEFSNKHYKLNGIQIDTFFHQKNMEIAIKKYLKNPDKLDCSNVLIQEFFDLFDEEDFSREDADLILNTFFEIIDVEIEKYPELIIYLDHYLAKLTYCEVQETNQGVKELSQGVKEISQKVQEIHEVINKDRKDQNRIELNTDFEESIKKYLNKIIEEEGKNGISEVYTELSAKEILPITLKFRNEENDKTQEFEVLELVEKEEKLIISGESGSGKTTTLRWLNFTFATKYLENKECSIPLYVELNSYRKGPFYDYFKRQIKKKGLSETTLKTLLEGKAIILLDGLDLLSPAENFFPYDEISDFFSDYSNCQIIISSRSGFFESIRRDFKVSELEKLTDGKIQIFIEKYVEEKELADTLKDKILNNEQLKSILSNPMMLYIAIKVAMGRKDQSVDLLPSNRSELYEAFISTLFSHHEEKGNHLHADRIQIENALTDLYFKLQCRNEVSCKYSEALKFVKKSAEDDTFRKTTSQDILEGCCKIGLLVEKDSEIEYGIHQSFQEYFAAIKLKELFESGFDISEAFSHPRWEKVVIFASEMLNSNLIDKFIDLMLSKGEFFLASKCVSNASYEIKEKLCTLLANKLNSKFIFDKKNSIQSLGNIGDIGIDLLTEALNDEDFQVSKYAVEALGDINSEKSIELLIKTFNNENSAVRGEIAETLGQIKAVKAVESLIKALNAERYVQLRAVEALGQMKYKKTAELLIKALENENYEVRDGAIYALGEIKSEIAIEPLMKIIQNGDSEVRSEAIYALGQMKFDKIVERLTTALRDKDPKIREGAAEVFREMKLEDIPKILSIAIRDPDSKVRGEVANALGQIKSEKAVDLLINALSDVDSEVRGKVIIALGQTGSQKAVELLISILSEDDLELRTKAANSLKQIKSEKTLQLLINALNDKDYRVRELAANTLGCIKSRKAIEPLKRILDDVDPRVQKQAEEALKEINSQRDVEWIIKSIIESINDENFKLKWRYIQKLEQIKSEEAAEPLLIALRHKNSDVRLILARLFGRIKSKKAVEPLIELLDDKSNWIRRYAAHSLGNIKSEKAISPLINTLNDDDYLVRGAAAGALRNCCTLQNKEQLDKLLKSDNIFLKNTAFEILSEIEKEEKSKIILFKDLKKRSKITPKYGIFVSSVQKELENERVTIQDLVENDPFLSEHYTSLLYEYEPAYPEKTLEGCLNTLNRCQVYLLIVWMKYGTLVGEISITHREYRYAKEKGFPILVFIKGERNIEREQGTEALLRETESDDLKYKRFRNVIELRNEVKESLNKLLRDEEKFLKT